MFCLSLRNLTHNRNWRLLRCLAERIIFKNFLTQLNIHLWRGNSEDFTADIVCIHNNNRLATRIFPQHGRDLIRVLWRKLCIVVIGRERIVARAVDRAAGIPYNFIKHPALAKRLCDSRAKSGEQNLGNADITDGKFHRPRLPRPMP